MSEIAKTSSATAGPYEVEPRENRDHPLCICTGESGHRIAKCSGFPFDDREPLEIRATARLLAASWDLRAALRLSRPYLVDHRTNIVSAESIDGDLSTLPPGVRAEVDEIDRHLAVIDAAIVKAGGGA